MERTRGRTNVQVVVHAHNTGDTPAAEVAVAVGTRTKGGEES